MQQISPGAVRARQYARPSDAREITPQEAGGVHAAHAQSMVDAGLLEPFGIEQLAWRSAAQEPTLIEIYFSSGPSDDGCSCDYLDQSSCSIYRIRWNLAESRIEGSVQRVVASAVLSEHGWMAGQVQAEVNTVTGALTFIERAYSDGEVKSATLNTIDDPLSAPNSIRNLDSGTRGPERPQWPSWVRSGVVMYEKANGNVPERASERMRTLYTQRAADTTGTTRKERLGPRGSGLTGVSIGNPRAFSYPAYRNNAGLRIVSFGFCDPESSDLAGVCDTVPNPRVHGLSESDAVEKFAIDRPSSGGDPLDFHHPDWSDDGTKILTTRHSRPDTNGDFQVYPLVQWEWDDQGEIWVQAGNRLDPLDLTDIPPPVTHDGAGSMLGERLFFKYARWVNSSHVLATVYAAGGEESETEIAGSRVLLIKQDGGGRPIYYDLTALAQVAFASDARPFRGIFASWRPVA